MKLHYEQCVQTFIKEIEEINNKRNIAKVYYFIFSNKKILVIKKNWEKLEIFKQTIVFHTF